MITEINTLKRKIEDLEGEIKRKETQFENSERLHKQEMATKEEEISSLKRKINDMSTEFSSMLKETLEKMEQRINMAQWNDKDNTKLLNKVSEDPLGND